jgi:hypothetical protein
MASLEFCSTSEVTCIRDLDTGNLENYMQQSEGRGDLLGQLLIVEDLSRDVIDVLGSNLHVDPKFFAHHLCASRAEKTAVKGYAYALPSVTRKRDYLNIQYARSIIFSGTEHPATPELLCSSNVRRKVTMTTAAHPATNGEFVGFVACQLSVSAIARRSGNCWFGELMLQVAMWVWNSLN